MKCPLYNIDGASDKTITLDDAYFGVKVSSVTIAQVLRAQIANRHAPVANTLRRGEVAGGGRKPWRQKGTGRARAGSIRSPLWRGGGVTFGPLSEKNPSLRIPAKMKRQATRAAMSAKAQDKSLKIIEADAAKTKRAELIKLMVRLEIADKTVLFITDTSETNLVKQIRNCANITVIGANGINLYDLLNHQAVVMTLAAYNALTGKQEDEVQSKTAGVKS